MTTHRFSVAPERIEDWEQFPILPFRLLAQMPRKLRPSLHEMSEALYPMLLEQEADEEDNGISYVERHFHALLAEWEQIATQSPIPTVGELLINTKQRIESQTGRPYAPPPIPPGSPEPFPFRCHLLVDIRVPKSLKALAAAANLIHGVPISTPTRQELSEALAADLAWLRLKFLSLAESASESSRELQLCFLANSLDEPLEGLIAEVWG